MTAAAHPGRPPAAAQASVGTSARARAAQYVSVRLTGLLLAVLVLGHLVVTHITTDVGQTDASFIARRWAVAGWLAWDWMMLAAALGHGALGVWVAIDEYSVGRRRRALRAVLVTTSGCLLALGSVVIARAVQQ